MVKLSNKDCIELLEKAQELIDEVLNNITDNPDAEMFIMNGSGDIEEGMRFLIDEE